MEKLVVDWILATEAQVEGKHLNEKQSNSIVELLELCTHNPSIAFSVICQLLATNPREKVIGCLGAGPLEDLLIQHCHFIEKTIEEAAKNKLLKKCLEYVNVDQEDCPNAQKLYDFLKN